jgi:hypothetical protein
MAVETMSRLQYLEQACQYLLHKAPDSIDMMPPLDRMRLLLAVSNLALLAPISELSETAASFLRNRLSQGDTDGEKAALQIDSLAAILALWTHYLPKPYLIASLPHLMGIISQHFFEKVSDDLAMCDADGRFNLRDVMLRFNEYAIKLVDDEISVSEAIEFTSGDLNLSGIRTQVSSVIDKLRKAQTGKLQEAASQYAADARSEMAMLLEFFRDPNKTFLNLNLLVTYHAARDIDLLMTRVDPRLAPLAEFAKDGLRNRYHASTIVLHQPDMPIEQAHIVGQMSILTDYTYATMLLAVAAAEPKMASEMIEMLEDITQAITDASTLIRDLNDVGPLLENPIGAKELIEHMRHTTNSALSPRDLFRQLAERGKTNADIQHIMHLLSRPIKDAIEQEYNMTLNSGEMGTNPAAMWMQFYYNMYCVAAEFQMTKSRLRRSLIQIMRRLPEVAYVIGSFVFFNHELYSQRTGDYDTHFAWTDLRSMHDATAWQDYFEISCNF